MRTDDPGKREDYRYSIELPSGREVSPPRGRHWNGKRPRYEQLKAENLLWFGENGDSTPRLKMFLDTATVGLVPTTWWPRDEVGDNDESKGEIQALFPDIGDPFATPKPEKLMHRIIGIASNPGDVVLDSFLGSGTTMAVAHKMGRRWIGVERNDETLDTYAVPRLSKVCEGLDPGGVTEAVNWQGGGGFHLLDVGPSMFESMEGQVFLSEWATNGKLTEVTAAQLHYDYKYAPPFCGRRGRSRLAVIDGLVSVAVVDLLVRALSEDERLVVCGTAIDPDAKTVLREARPGSNVRKIPNSILAEYRQAYQWVQTSLLDPAFDGIAGLAAEPVQA